MKELYKALAAFQQDVPNIYKNSQGYGYKFADLGEINEIIKPLLKKYGLGYVQPLWGNAVKTVIFHVESGESIESSAIIPQGVQLKGMNDFQVLGSAITYLRRYSLSSMLGLITDEDADAAGEQVKDKTYLDVVKESELPIVKPSANEETQQAILTNLLRQHGHTEKEDIQDFLQSEFGIKVVNGKADLSKEDIKFIIESLDNKGQ